MLHTKYQRSGLYGFREEDFLKILLWTRIGSQNVTNAPKCGQGLNGRTNERINEQTNKQTDLATCCLPQILGHPQQIKNATRAQGLKGAHLKQNPKYIWRFLKIFLSKTDKPQDKAIFVPGVIIWINMVKGHQSMLHVLISKLHCSFHISLSKAFWRYLF